MWERRNTEPDFSRDDARYVDPTDVDLARLERAMRRTRYAQGTNVIAVPVERMFWRGSARVPPRLSADAWRAAFASIRRD